MLHNNISSETIPDYLICPISKQIFLEPVTVIPNGRVYEKDMVDTLMAIAKVKGKIPICPVTREEIKSYVPARTIKDAVADYLLAHPTASSEQYQKANKIDSKTQKAIININNYEHSTSPTITQSPLISSEVIEQIRADEQFAIELQQEFDHEGRVETEETRLRLEMEARALAAFREQRDRERARQERMRQQIPSTENNQENNNNVALTSEENNGRKD